MAAVDTSRFTWTNELVCQLLDSLDEFKVECQFKSLDFNGDKVGQYEAIRKKMSVKAGHTAFGPVDVDGKNRGDVKKGYARIREKIKTIRRKFSTSVTTGTRSGSGKLVAEFYDRLVVIWGGCAATEPLAFGVTTDITLPVEADARPELVEDNAQPSTSSANGGPGVSQTQSQSSVVGGNTDHDYSSSDSATTSPAPARGKKRSINYVPKLIDNKRKNLEKTLSASQRDQIFLKEAKEEGEFRKELTKSIMESNDIFAKSMEAMSTSLTTVAHAMKGSMDIFTQVLIKNLNNQNK